MSAISDYLENALLNHIRGGTAFAQPGGLYLALYTAAPSDAGGGTEVAGNGYARQLVAFGAAASGTMANSAQEQFTASGGNWGSITHAAIFDAVSAGNMLWHGALTTARTVNDTDTLTFAIGDITFTLA